MGNKHNDNRDSILQTAGIILGLAAAAIAIYGIYCVYLFFQWLGEMSHQFYIYIGGAMGVARMLAMAMGVISGVPALLAWVGNERWAFHLCATLTSGAAMTFIMAWFVSSIEQLPQYFFLGMALYVAAAVFLNTRKH